jgi:hypothetical protein
VSVGAAFDSAITLKGRFELFGGDVDYDGETLPPLVEPLKTDVVYIGSKQELDLGYRFHYDAVRLEPFLGAGFRWWLRDLRASTTESGRPASGYTEAWQTAYGRFGLRGRYQVPAAVELFAEGGAKYPFYTGNSIDFTGQLDRNDPSSRWSQTATFHPGGRWSGFGEAGVSYRQARITIFYEGFRFAPSATKRVENQYYFQPQSSSDVVGLRLGWAFR